jgi:hypothetical protein
LVEGELHDNNVVENVGGIDSNFFDLITSNIVCNLLDVESMYFEFGNVVTIEVVQLVIIKIQVTLWKPHHCIPFVGVLLWLMITSLLTL